jgi:hypothetical protein
LVLMLATLSWLPASPSALGQPSTFEAELRASEARNRENTRTHDGPVIAERDEMAVEMLRALPPLSSMHGNGLRYVVMEHTITGYYGVSLSPNSTGRATGWLLTYSVYGETVIRRRTISASAAAYENLVKNLDAALTGYIGDDGGCTDGGPAAIELSLKFKVRSALTGCEDKAKIRDMLDGFLASETNLKELFEPNEGWRRR